MKREILFRGKPKDPSAFGFDFIYGSLRIEQDDLPDTHIIYDKDGVVIPVDPETVGQYTGLQDKNGTKIFEGDYLEGRGYKCRVEWNDYRCCFDLYDEDKDEVIQARDGYAYEVTGKIYEK